MAASNTSTIMVLTDEQFNNAIKAVQNANSNNTAELTTEQQKIVTSTDTKSDKIRKLLASGLKRGAVAKALGIRYQHVRNVELMPLKRKA